MFAGIGLVANVWFIRVVSKKSDINTFHRYPQSDADRTVDVGVGLVQMRVESN